MKQVLGSVREQADYQKEVVRRNCINFRIFAAGGVLITGLILMAGILLGNRTRFAAEYLFFFLYMVVLYALARWSQKKQPRHIVWVLYVALLPVYVVGILMGTIFDSSRPAITIMVLLCGLTLLLIDAPVRLLGYITIIAAAFSVVAYFTKERTVFITDMINLLIYGGISLGINYISLKERIESVRNYLQMQEIRRQQERIIENLPTGIIVFQVRNKEYSIIQVNPAICKMMDFDPDKAIHTYGDHILKLTHPEDISIVRDAAIQLVTPGVEVHYEFRTRNRTTGAYFWTAADGKSVAQPDGSVLVYIGYANINARREQEEEYKRRIQALDEMDDETLIAKGHHNLTRNQVLLFMSKCSYAAQVQMNGSYDDAVQALADVTVTSDRRNEVLQTTGREHLIEEFHKGNVDGALEFRRYGPEKQTIWTTVRYSLFEEPGTGDIMAFMYSYDITERVMERKIMAKLGSMEYDLFGVIDVSTGQFTMLNQMNTLNGHVSHQKETFDDMITSYILKLPNPTDREKLQQVLTVAHMVEELEHKDLCSLLYGVDGEDGRRLQKRFRFIYLDESKDAIMFFRNDITEMYEKEQEQLRETEEALNAARIASSAKTEFFSRMSHDMRTPMNGILGLAELSSEEEDLTVLKRNIEKIRESGQYLLGLINDTLDFQRIESGKLTLEPEIVNANQLVENTIDMVERTASSKGVTLLVNKTEILTDTYIQTDPLRLKQIFVNLLSNAVKFTPAGGMVEFAVKVVERKGQVRHTRITVKDTGIGMSEEFINTRIFQPFSQESNQVTAKYAGSGLGLSIARRLVEMMDGQIEVTSELGTGSTFTVSIPFTQVDLKNLPELMQNEQEHIQDISEKLTGRHILLVEDHPLNAEIAMRLLQKKGCHVDWVKNGQEAVEQFTIKKNQIYDGVLMDIRMPVMDGLEATRQIRAIEDAYAMTVPIIAMTANAYEDDIKHSLEAGMNAHLSKPVEPEKLYTVLADNIDVNH